MEKIELNKYKDNNVKVTNNRFAMSKSYKNIEERDDKKEKEENKNTWRFNIKNKEDDIIGKKVENIQQKNLIIYKSD